MDVTFSLHGTKVELNFPKSERFSPVEPPSSRTTFDPQRIQELVRAFRRRWRRWPPTTRSSCCATGCRAPGKRRRSCALGKSLYIPSTTEDFPQRDPFPDERVITKTELIRLEEETWRPRPT